MRSLDRSRRRVTPSTTDKALAPGFNNQIIQEDCSCLGTLLALYLPMLKLISQKKGELQWKINEIALKFK